MNNIDLIKKKSFKNIEELRKQSDMSVSELLKKLGHSSSTTYYRWSQGANISASDVVKMSLLFNVSADFLLGLTDRKTQ